MRACLPIPKSTRQLLLINVENVDVFFFGEILIGIRTPDNIGFRLSHYFDNVATDKAIKNHQRLVGLKASWVREVDRYTLEREASRYWIKAFGEYARQRMMGNV